MADSMVRRVAQAICGFGDSCCINTLRSCGYEAVARDAIMAMRDSLTREDVARAILPQAFIEAERRRLTPEPLGPLRWDTREAYEAADRVLALTAALAETPDSP